MIIEVKKYGKNYTFTDLLLRRHLDHAWETDIFTYPTLPRLMKFVYK